MVEIEEAFGTVAARSQGEAGRSDEAVHPHGSGIALAHHCGLRPSRSRPDRARTVTRRWQHGFGRAYGGGHGDDLILTRCSTRS
ncbi:MAG: hypothetical protein ABWX92_03865 [Mycetocola sp.]